MEGASSQAIRHGQSGFEAVPPGRLAQDAHGFRIRPACPGCSFGRLLSEGKPLVIEARVPLVMERRKRVGQ
jgi:hypothetical protein